MTRPASRVRVLVLSADIGESHAQMARALRRELELRDDVESVSVLSGFASLGPILERVLDRGFRFHLGEVKWSYDLAYRLFTGFTPAKAAGEKALCALGAAALQAAVARHDPDIVVSTYPVMNPVLSELRSRWRLTCPAVAVVGPLGGLGFWVQPHLDLHLAQYEQAVGEIESLAAGAPVRAVRPLVREEFFEPRPRAEARRHVGLPTGVPVVLVSGGGWGVGDLSGAIERSLELAEVHVLAVTGRNKSLRQMLDARYSKHARVRVLGFINSMRDLLCAADAFVTASAGLSCMEARLCRCPTVVYGFAVGHVRDNRRALEAHGLVCNADTLAQLTAALQRVLARGRSPALDWKGMPTAAQLTVALARKNCSGVRAVTNTSSAMVEDGPTPASASV